MQTRGVTDVSMSHLSTIHLKVPIKVENNSKFEHRAQWLFYRGARDALCIPSTGSSPQCNLVWTLLLLQQNRAEFFLNVACCIPLIFCHFSFPPTETLTKADRFKRYRALLNIFLAPVLTSSYFLLFYFF